jgi:hypothetical protein
MEWAYAKVLLRSTMNETMIVGEAIAGRSATVRKELARMATSMSTSEFDMIELLCEALENSYAPQWGYASLLDYGQKELGLKPRRTQYLTRIGKVMKAVGLKRGQYEPAKVSKLREIASLNPEGSFFNRETRVSEPFSEHIVRLVLDSDELTVEQVHNEVLRLQGRTGPDRPVHRTTVYPQSVWELVIKPARELARQLLGSSGRDDEGTAKEYSDAACDEVICAAFLADPNNAPEPEDVTIELPMENL